MEEKTEIRLLSPADGEKNVPLLPRRYLELVQKGERLPDGRLNLRPLYYDPEHGEDLSIPRPVSFRWESTRNAVHTLYIGTRADMSDARRITATKDGCDVYHLYAGQTYYWHVTAHRPGDRYRSETRTFTTDPTPPRTIFAPDTNNIRDLGGRRTLDGRRIRQGLLYRGATLETAPSLNETGVRVLRDDLGIRTDLDLRGEAYGSLCCSPLGGDRVRLVHVSANGYAPFMEPPEHPVCLGIFRTLAKRENYPVYFHCYAGADRTGTVALLVGALLGVSEAELKEDYEWTALAASDARSADSPSMTAFLAALHARAGDTLQEQCRDYLREVGMTDEELDEIGRILLEEETQ